MEPTEAASNIRAYFTCVSRLTIVILAYIHRTCASCAAAVVLLLLLILVAPVPAGGSRAIWRSRKPAALAAHSRHPLPAQHRCERSTLSFYTYFPLPASTATPALDSWRCGGREFCKPDLGMKKKKKRESKQEKKRNFVDVMSRQKPRTDAAGMWQCEVCSHHKRCKAVQSVHHLLHVAAAQITKAIRVASAHI